MRHSKSVAIITTLIFLCSLNTKAQEPNLKFGSPTNEELKMTEYSFDKNASAVTLCSLTEVYYEINNNNFFVNYNIKKRIKILKAEGKDFANIKIPYHYNDSEIDNRENITKLKATAYNIENGKTVKTEMNKNMIFSEKVNENVMLLKFTVPQVKVGTVIEYQYTLKSPRYYDIYDWYAQSEIPTMYTKYDLTIPEFFIFNVEESGLSPIKRECKPTNWSSTYNNNILNGNATEYIFNGTNMPALKKDDFVWYEKDYCNKVVCELCNITIPGFVYDDYTSSWTKIDGILKDDDDFGGRLGKSDILKEETAKIDKNASVEDKVACVFRILKKHVRWNGEYYLWGKSAHDVLKEGTGNNADINFMMINMLNDIDVKAMPIIMSDRNNGRLPLTHPSIKSLSTFVVGAWVNDSTLTYIDASSKDGYVNVLPPKLQVAEARAIEKNSSFWVNLQNLPASKKIINVTGTIDNAGHIKGKIQCLMNNNIAEEFRNDFRNAKDSATYVTGIANDDGIEIDKCEMTGQREFAQNAIYNTEFTKNCDVTDNHIYINPMIITPIKKNPFSDEKRLMPIEFPFKQSLTINVNLAIPQGYTIESMPKGMKIALPDNNIFCSIISNVDDKKIAIQYRFKINSMFISYDKYDMVKDLYTKIVEKNKDMFILKKIAQ